MKSSSHDPAGHGWHAKILHLVLQGWLIVLLLAPNAVAADEYRLAPGDILRVMIVGNPELSIDVPIEMDGSAWFPLVGPVHAGGITLGDLRGRTAEAYATMSLSRPVSSNADMPQFIDNRQVYIGVAAYRPIYVTGDVGALREVPFRPGLTLQHLFALTSFRPTVGGAPATTAGQIEAAASALAHEYAQIWRQKTFLGTDTPDDFDRIFLGKGPVFDEIAAVQRSILEQTRASLTAQQESLKDEISRAKTYIIVLGLQKKNENAGLMIDERTLAEVEGLFERNLVPTSRLTEVRRAALLTASRVFQIDVALEGARRQIGTLEADIAAVDSDARIRALKDLADAVALVPQRRSELETLMATDAGNPQSSLVTTGIIAVVTRDGAAFAPADTSSKFALMPGDIVDIRFILVGISDNGGTNG